MFPLKNSLACWHYLPFLISFLEICKPKNQYEFNLSTLTDSISKNTLQIAHLI